MNHAARVLAGFALVVGLAVPAWSAPIRLGFNSTALPRNDDGSTAAVGLGFTLNFFGAAHNTAFVNNNGNLTFVTGLGTFTPFGLTGNTGIEIIAPFFADVDTNGAASGLVRYGTGTVDGHSAFGATYVDVGYYPGATNKLNDFQVILIDRSDVGAGDFDIEFNYEDINWETGGASGGVNGLGGSSARAGFSRGTGVAGTFFELPGSGVNGALLDTGGNALVNGSFNSSTPGRYLFEVRNGGVAIPGLTPDAPFLPNSSIPGGPGETTVYFFNNVPSGRWFDPPFATSFTYQGLLGTLFTSVMLPAGFGNQFILSAVGCTFNPFYTSLILIDLVAPCGGTGPSLLTISGLTVPVDVDDPAGFPTFFNFNTATGSFSMQGNVSTTGDPIPEPATLALTLAGLSAAVGARRRRRQGR